MINLLDLKSVFDFVIDGQEVEQTRVIAKKFELPQERFSELYKLTSAILKGEVQYQQMPTFIGAAFGLDEGKAKLVAADLAGYRLLPLQLYLPGIRQAIVEWGGNPASYPQTVVPKEKVTPEALIEKFAKDLNLTLPEVLMKRFAYLCRGYLLGERTREGTMVLFKRPITIGGLEMSDAQTLRCLDLLDSEKENVEVVEMELGTQHEGEANVQRGEVENVETNPPPVIEEVSKEEPIITEPPKPEVSTTDIHHELVKTVTAAITTSVPTISGEMIEHHEKKEIEVAKKVVAQQQVVEDPAEKAKRDAAVNAALAPVVELFKKHRCSKQDFTDIASAHVRGRREYHQTESLLRDRCKLEPAEIDVAMKALEAGRAIVGAGSPRPSVEPAVNTGQGSPAPTAPNITDASVLDARFAALTKKVPDVPIDPIMPTARVSASRTKEEELAMQAAKVDPVKTAQAETESKPEKAQVFVSAASAPIAARPAEVVTDVQYVTNLIGPVEEIGTMTPEQFRRLSSDPMEAIRKIEDKLALLQNLSYADRIRGVEGWRKNPISVLYLSMTREALMAGISLSELAAKRRSAGQESLSPAEITAVVELNKRIGF